MSLDHIITLATILLILSVVVEKTTQLIRSYPDKFAFLFIAICLFSVYGFIGVFSSEVLLGRVALGLPYKLHWSILILIFGTIIFAVPNIKELFGNVKDVAGNYQKSFEKKSIVFYTYKIPKITFWVIITCIFFICVVGCLLASASYDQIYWSIITPVFLSLVFGLFFREINTEKLKLWHVIFYLSLPLVVFIWSGWENTIICYLYFFLGSILCYYPLVTLQWIKPITISYLQQNGDIKVFELRFFRNITKGSVPDETSKKDREISLLSFTISFLICFCFQLDFQKLVDMAHDPLSINLIKAVEFEFQNGFLIGIDEKALNVSFLGIVFLSFFLSFGSKFFHDLLELLFQVKNYRKKAADLQTYQNEGLAEMKEYLDLTEGQLARMAIDQNRKKLQALANYHSLFAGRKKIGDVHRVLPILNITNANTEFIPLELQYQLPSGSRKSIELHVEPNVGPARASSRPGDPIAKEGTENRVGTLGCVLQNPKNQYFALTCAHVLNEGRHDSDYCDGFLNDSKKKEVKTNSDTIGKWIFGYQNIFYDTAFVELDLNGIPPRSGMLEDCCPYNEVTTGLQVSFSGNSTNNGSGKVVGILEGDEEIPVEFANETIRMKRLIMVSHEDPDGSYHSISDEGDSGAVLFDENNAAVGMIISFNSKYTYAIYMDWICSNYQLKIH